MSEHSILLLDDDEEILKALRRFLRKRGYAVTATAWPTEAVELVGREGTHFDFLVIDLRMPVISGFVLMRALRESHPEIRVIVLSAFVSQENCHTAQEMGAIACLEKPVDTRALLAILAQSSVPRNAAPDE